MVSPPPPGMLKLNFDGNVLGNPGRAVVGGVIRNENGLILLSYSGPAGFCSINKAELLALNIGMREASRLNPQWLLVEGDSACVFQWASNPSTVPWYMANIIEEMTHLSGELNISFSHIKCSANAKADNLAKEGVSKPSLIVSLC
ncbi:hypothetical protein AAC387_Pa02g3723 [Persea americana]